jgi:hypothetical protein
MGSGILSPKEKHKLKMTDQILSNKVNEVGEKYIVRSSIICSHHLERWKQMGDTEGHYRRWNRSVITVKSLWAGGPDFHSRQGQEIFSSSPNLNSLWEALRFLST